MDPILLVLVMFLQLASILQQEHCLNCKHKSVRCPNEGCDIVLPASSLDAHVDECGFRRVSCQHCSMETSANQMEVIFLNTLTSVVRTNFSNDYNGQHLTLQDCSELPCALHV